MLRAMHWMQGLRSFVGGRLVNVAAAHEQGMDGRTFTLRSPATDERVTKYPMASDACIDAAIASNQEAFAAYSQSSGKDRQRWLGNLARLVEQNREHLSELETLNTGRPLSEVRDDMDGVVECFNFFAAAAAIAHGRHFDLDGGAFGYTRREPLGVCVGIGAWNFPLLGLAWKLAPALACGNTFTFKPAELTPATAVRLAALANRAGFPEGTFNVVLGDGEIGMKLVQHDAVAKVSFTGSTSTGAAVYAAAAKDIKHATMELGGKSPLIVCEDANMDEAVAAAVSANFYATGQVCSNGTRVFVHENIKDEFTRKLVEATLKLRIGDPFDPHTDMGPLVSHQQRDRVLAYVRAGVSEGATRLVGGRSIDDPEMLNSMTLVKGAFVSPCIFTDCTDDMTIVREEIFGPVLCLLSFASEEEVISRANDTPYGLAAGVFTNDLRRAHRLAAKLQAGTVWINDYNLSPAQLPWGGQKKSGIGRENGLEALSHWSQAKSVYVKTTV